MQPISLLCSQYQHFPGHVPSFLSLFFSGQRIGQREGNWFDPLVKRSGDCRKWDNGINELLCSRTEGTLIKLRWDARHDKPAGVLDHVPEASLNLPFPFFLFFLFFIRHHACQLRLASGISPRVPRLETFLVMKTNLGKESGNDPPTTRRRIFDLACPDCSRLS